MEITQKSFERYHLEKKEDTFTVKLNAEERIWLETMKQLISQPKDSTALKQLARLGSKVLLDEKTMDIARMVYENKLKNKRTGIPNFTE